MKTRLSLFFGIFTVMALSNAIVPVLPAFARTSGLQGSLYAAYFLGAFFTTLPAGILSDRYGRVPLIRLGLAVTVLSGLFLSWMTAPVPVIAVRFLEGTGAGCFVAAAMSYVNSSADHERLSGYFMAFLNAGLIAGLVLGGWLESLTRYPSAGILLFAGLTLIPAAASAGVGEPGSLPEKKDRSALRSLVSEYRWLWYSSIILVGVTGVVSSLYPEFSGVSPDIVGIWIAGMSGATIVAVLAVSRLSLPPVPVIRWSAVLMVPGILLAFYSPLGFLLVGGLAGVVMIAQMAFLSTIREHQGVAMGLFSTTSYLGMAVLPLITGVIADSGGFFYAFCATAFFAITVALTIGRCACREQKTLQAVR